MPRTVENFLALCSRPKGEGFAGSSFHCIRKGFGIEGGDYLRGDGRGGRSAFATPLFADENFVGRHSVPGTISMCNSGVDSNSSIFFVSLAPQPHLGAWRALGGLVGATLFASLRRAVCGALPSTPLCAQMGGTWCSGTWSRDWRWSRRSTASSA